MAGSTEHSEASIFLAVVHEIRPSESFILAVRK